LKNALARGTPDYRKWQPWVPRHSGWEPLPKCVLCNVKKSLITTFLTLFCVHQWH